MLIELAAVLPIALVAHALAIILLLILECLFQTFSTFSIPGFFADAYSHANSAGRLVIRYYRWAPVYLAGTIYILCISGLAFYVGRVAGKGIITGPLRMFARHKWIYELIQAKRRENAYVLAHVMTHIRQDHRVLMYRGYLEEFYFAPDGSISYLLIRKCHRLYMHLNEGASETSQAQFVLPIGQTESPSDGSDTFPPLLLIEGDDIANVVFERTPAISTTEIEIEELDQSLREDTA